jgi:hypothetical protein
MLKIGKLQTLIQRYFVNYEDVKVYLQLKIEPAQIIRTKVLLKKL